MENTPEKLPSILFVDHDRDFGEYVVRFLREKGYSVEFYYRADKAMKYIKSDMNYDLIVIGDNLQDICAEEIAEISSKEHPKAPIMSFSIEDDQPEWAKYNCSKCRVGYQGFDYLIGRINRCIKGYG